MPDDALPTVTPELRALRERYAAFMEEHVYPNERAFAADDDGSDALIATLRARAQDAGLWAPHIGPEAGGTGLGFLSYAFLNEVIGRSYWGQLVFGCQAPDAGNSEILHTFGTPEQRRDWLAPLVAGDVRSFFGMTEPEVSGADPTGLECRASRDGGDWVIDGHKWFSTGADGSAFGIVMAVTDPEDAPHRHMSMIIVPTDAPGVEVVRNIEVFGHAGRGWNSHSEVRFENVRVPAENLLGERGAGFAIAQQRLGPGRIHHAMRWLGQMQRAFDLMCSLQPQPLGLRRPARRQADGPGLDRRLRRRDQRVPPDDARRRGQDRSGRAGTCRGVGPQVLLGAGAAQRHRPRRADARGIGRVGRLAALGHVPQRPLCTHLRRPG